MPNQQSFEVRHDVNYISKYKSHIAYMYHYRHENLKKKKVMISVCVTACIFFYFVDTPDKFKSILVFVTGLDSVPPLGFSPPLKLKFRHPEADKKVQCFCYPLRKHMLQHFEHSCHRNIQCIQRSHGQCTRFGMFIYRSLRDVG